MCIYVNITLFWNDYGRKRQKGVEVEGKRAGARWVKETQGKKLASRRRVAVMYPEKGGFFFFFLLNMAEGWRSNKIDKGKRKKREFRDERGCKEEDVGGTGERGKRTERERERLNSSGKWASSAEQWECGAVLIRVARWEMTICLLLFFIRTWALLLQKALHTQHGTFFPTGTVGN